MTREQRDRSISTTKIALAVAGWLLAAWMAWGGASASATRELAAAGEQRGHELAALTARVAVVESQRADILWRLNRLQGSLDKLNDKVGVLMDRGKP